VVVLTTKGGRGLISSAHPKLEVIMKIRITAAGVGVVILGRSDHHKGAVLTVPRYDGDYFINNGFAVLVKDEPEPAKEEAEESATAPVPETATAEPAGEMAVEPHIPRRKGA
jgi:hypothetical protein